VITCWLIFFRIGHHILVAFYWGKGNNFFNELFQDFYWLDTTGNPSVFIGFLFCVVIAVILIGILFYISIFIWLTRRKEFFKFLNFENFTSYFSFLNRTQWLDFKKKNKIIIRQCGVLFFCFLLIYLSCGIIISNTRAFFIENILFDIDTHRVIADMTDHHALHYRSSHHPLFVLLVNPLGSFLKVLFQNRVLAALFVNASCAAAGVVLAYLFCRLYCRNNFNAFLMAIAFGLTMSQIFFGSVPDTSTLAVCSLITTYALFFRHINNRDIPLPVWVLAGIFTFGITVTNFFQTLICYSLLIIKTSRNNEDKYFHYSKIPLYIVCVLLITGILSLVQKMLYPSSVLFFFSDILSDELKYVTDVIIKQPQHVLIQIIKHFFLVNFVAPFPGTYSLFTNISIKDPAITFALPSMYHWIGYLASGVWLSVFIASMRQLFLDKEKKWFHAGMTLCLLFNVLMHSVYGTNAGGHLELFSFCANFTFLVFSFTFPVMGSSRLIPRVCLVIFIVAMGVNNFIVFNEIIKLY